MYGYNTPSTKLMPYNSQMNGNNFTPSLKDPQFTPSPLDINYHTDTFELRPNIPPSMRPSHRPYTQSHTASTNPPMKHYLVKQSILRPNIPPFLTTKYPSQRPHSFTGFNFNKEKTAKPSKYSVGTKTPSLYSAAIVLDQKEKPKGLLDNLVLFLDNNLEDTKNNNTQGSIKSLLNIVNEETYIDSEFNRENDKETLFINNSSLLNIPESNNIDLIGDYLGTTISSLRPTVSFDIANKTLFKFAVKLNKMKSIGTPSDSDVIFYTPDKQMHTPNDTQFILISNEELDKSAHDDYFFINDDELSLYTDMLMLDESFENNELNRKFGGKMLSESRNENNYKLQEKIQSLNSAFSDLKDTSNVDGSETKKITSERTFPFQVSPTPNTLSTEFASNRLDQSIPKSLLDASSVETEREQTTELARHNNQSEIKEKLTLPDNVNNFSSIMINGIPFFYNFTQLSPSENSVNTLLSFLMDGSDSQTNFVDTNSKSSVENITMNEFSQRSWHQNEQDINENSTDSSINTENLNLTMKKVVNNIMRNISQFNISLEPSFSTESPLIQVESPNKDYIVTSIKFVTVTSTVEKTIHLSNHINSYSVSASNTDSLAKGTPSTIRSSIVSPNNIEKSEKTEDKFVTSETTLSSSGFIGDNMDSHTEENELSQSHFNSVIDLLSKLIYMEELDATSIKMPVITNIEREDTFHRSNASDLVRKQNITDSVEMNNEILDYIIVSNSERSSIVSNISNPIFHEEETLDPIYITPTPLHIVTNVFATSETNKPAIDIINSINKLESLNAYQDYINNSTNLKGPPILSALKNFLRNETIAEKDIIEGIELRIPMSMMRTSLPAKTEANDSHDLKTLLTNYNSTITEDRETVITEDYTISNIINNSGSDTVDALNINFQNKVELNNNSSLLNKSSNIIYQINKYDELDDILLNNTYIVLFPN